MSVSTYSLSLARTPDLLWSLQPSDNLTAHPLHPFPPMAFPASYSTNEALAYAASLLQTALVTSPALLPSDWHVYGHTNTAEGRQPAYRTAWTVSVQSLDSVQAGLTIYRSPAPSPKGV